MINGEGNPQCCDAANFSERMSALYNLTYAVKINYKIHCQAGC